MICRLGTYWDWLVEASEGLLDVLILLIVWTSYYKKCYILWTYWAWFVGAMEAFVTLVWDLPSMKALISSLRFDYNGSIKSVWKTLRVPVIENLLRDNFLSDLHRFFHWVTRFHSLLVSRLIKWTRIRTGVGLRSGIFRKVLHTGRWGYAATYLYSFEGPMVE